MATFGITVHVRNGSDHGPDIPGATVSCDPVPVQTGADGIAIVEDFDVTVTAEGFLPYEGQRYHRPAIGPEMPIALQPREPQAPESLPRIHVDGIDFRDERGQRWIWRGMTDFLLYQRYLAGENLTPILEQRRALGANVLRVLGMVDSFSHFHPQEHGDYYERLSGFVGECANYGLYVEFVVFADAQIIMPDVNAQRAHLDQVAGALRDQPNVFLELCNEFDKNGVNPTQFSKPDAMMCSSGSGLGDGIPAWPAWNYTTFHVRRDLPKMLLDAQPIELIYGWGNTSKPFVWANASPDFPGFHQPVVQDEPIGAAENDHPGKRSNNPEVFTKFGRACGNWNGGTFHSDQGVQSQLLDGRQKDCALAFFEAVR